MKLTIDRDAALDALGRVQGLVSRKTTIPALEHVRLLANGALHLHATDLDAEADLSVSCETLAEGAATAPAARLIEALKSSPAGGVSVELDGARLRILAGSARFALPSLPPEELPSFDTSGLDDIAEVDAAAFLRLIDTVEHAAGRDAARFGYMGINLAVKDGLLIARACAGYKAAWAQMGCDGALAARTFPLSELPQLRRFLDGRDTVKLSASDRLIGFTTLGGRFVSKILDAGFPDIERAIPNPLPPLASVESADLLAAVRRVQVGAEGDARVARVGLAEGRLTLAASSFSGEASDEIPAVWDLEPRTCVIPLRQVQAAVSALDAEVVEIGLTEVAMLLRPAASERPLAMISYWAVQGGSSEGGES